MTITVKQFFKQFPDDAACLAHLFEVRYGQGHSCPKCERTAKWCGCQIIGGCANIYK